MSTTGHRNVANLELHTPRLRLRPARPEDATALAISLTDAEAMRFVGDGRPWSPARVERWIQASMSSFAATGTGVFMIEQATTSEVLGWCGLEPGEDTGEIELNYAVNRAHWGSGIGGEATRAVIDYADSILDVVWATVDPSNRASLRILDRLGFTLVDARPDVHGILTLFLIRSRPVRAGN